MLAFEQPREKCIRAAGSKTKISSPETHRPEKEKGEMYLCNFIIVPKGS